MDTVNTGPEEAAGDSPAGDTPDTVPEAPAGQTQAAGGSNLAEIPARWWGIMP